ncbi:microtubule-binding protein MIP-T3 domain-containing protein [Ditylenchus destructor]|uniref:TRAF3-interacting protein 1 n=1 Tax=Ditylenchus destructor TaxID=166010 RepID=A0AAD4NCQ7_9BILA|nr:microtubule-binding protein MIP-T3 domain-containing protein [Ditylenchus destructor]
MYTSRTKELFSSLIQKPPLTDQLLQRPPFKFLHDIVNETVRTTGFLDGVFSRDELDPTKASASRDTKLGFLQKVVDILNVDGSLDDVKPAKIVAGKEPELTNLLLQKLATEAALHLAASKKTSKHKTARAKKTIKEGSEKKSSKEKTPTQQSPAVSSKDVPVKAPSKKSRVPEASSTRSKSKTRKTTKEKTPPKKEESALPTPVDRPISRIQKENRRESPHDRPQVSSAESGRKSAGAPLSSRTLPDRESSGGTSKGGDDSGIADETGAESERHDSERITVSTTSDAQRHDLIGTPSRRKSPEFFDISPSTSNHAPQIEEIPKFTRPTTAAGRPQTSLGRPGTTMTRAPPPKIKKTKVGEIDPMTVSPQPVTAGTAALILEDKSNNKERDTKTAESADQFLIEEDDEVAALEPSDSARAAAINVNQDEHGVLVNRIVENTRELEKHIQSKIDLSEGTDPHESRRIRIEIESIQKAIQTASQNLQPLGRSIEYVADEFDAMLKEIEDSRKATAKHQQMLHEATTESGSSTFALASTLRNLDAEIKDVRQHISSVVATIITNEKKIASLMQI